MVDADRRAVRVDGQLFQAGRKPSGAAFSGVFGWIISGALKAR